MISLKLGTLLFSFGYVPITNHLYLQVGQSLRVWMDDLCRGGFDTLTGDEPFFYVYLVYCFYIRLSLWVVGYLKNEQMLRRKNGETSDCKTCLSELTLLM